MIQELFRIGPLAISPFGVLLVAAFLAAYLQLQRGLTRLGIGDPDTASALLFAGGVGGVLGAKIYYAILHGDWRLLLERSGLVWYGGFVLGTAAVAWTMHRRRLPPWPTLDALAPALALGYGVGRVGCFLVGDDYGVPTTLPWGIAYADGLPPTTAYYLRREFGLELPASISDDTLLSVHPTQLYETAIALAIWWIGVRLLRRRPAPGRTALVVFALLALERFGVEFLRVKDDRLLGGLTLAQAISLAILVAVAALWRRPGAAAPPPPRAAEARR
ncbi:MAG: Prolipoprotein diacylglyceryl transferase [Acidobacteria bacterium]|jgi:phosphatidylglycerol:prolipoprotein diacylglycerol transferase|nr:Prolipoprotein diacylglyceryl transferase [Acidobacteriota bacterium]